MVLGQYNPHARYKERAAQRTAALFKTIAIVVVFTVIGFWFGKQYGAEQLVVLKETLNTTEEERNDLQDQLTEANASAQTANMRFEKLQEEVQNIIPKGPMQDLVTKLREQLDKGTDPERLSFVIRSARPPTGCIDPESKRFIVSTPANKGEKSIVQIEDGAIKITGLGVSARSSSGAPEAWYDQGKKVTIFFNFADKTETKSGVLPLRHSLVLNNREYRFTIEKGARSFAKVVFDSCNYP